MLQRVDWTPLTRWLLWIVGGVVAFAFFYFGWQTIHFPFPVDYGEGPLLNHLNRIVAGAPLYPPPATRPTVITNYPPLFLWLQLPFRLISGPAFWYGRLFAFVSALVAAICAGGIVRVLTRQQEAAVVTTLLMLGMPAFAFWAGLSRVDMLALALNLAGLWWLLAKPERRWDIGIAAFIWLAAAFTRQDAFLTAPVAGIVWLTATGRFPQRNQLIITLAVTGLLLFALTNWQTDGGFYFHLIVANVNTYSFPQLRWFWQPILLWHSGFWLITLALWRQRQTERATFWLLGSYLVTAIFAALGSGKLGANFNYFLPLTTALCLIAGVWWAQMRIANATRWPALLLVVQLLILLSLSRQYQSVARHRIDAYEPTVVLEKLIDASDGPLLADEQLGLLALANRPVDHHPFEMTQLAAQGLWNPAPLTQAVAEQSCEMIIIYQTANDAADTLVRQRWPEPVLDAIRTHYVATDQIQGTIIYRPRKE